MRRPFRSTSSRRSGALSFSDAAHESPRRQSNRDKASWDFEEGAQIAPGRSVLERLGGGRRYEVFLVWDERLSALAVAKLVRPDQAGDAVALTELRREAEILERLAHPVLVRGFDAVLDGPNPHVLLEHLDGVTLRNLIKRHGSLPLEQLVPLAMHVLAALHYMSVEGFVHLDVKPSNIVMGLPPRLIDLSVARSVESAARIQTPIGTDAYIAPEQCDPRSHPGQVGPPADVWGLGVTLYYAIAGERPFRRARGARESEDLTVRFPQLVSEPAPLPKDVPPALESLVVRMLAEDPADRPTAAEAVDALEPFTSPLLDESSW